MINGLIVLYKNRSCFPGKAVVQCNQLLMEGEDKMDLIQTLILYMTMTYATAISGAMPPENMPSPTPTAVVETAAPQETMPQITPAVETAVPEPEVTPAPQPTITPNTGYRILRRRDKNDNVRAMQERLKELGYLNGTVDGAFGDQTWRAVIDFQRANGLKPDGEAGPATLTRLFEDPTVIPNLAAMTPTPLPTSTPGPDGLVPIPEEGTESWVEIHLHTILYQGESLTVVDETGHSAAPGMYYRGAELMLSLDDLAQAANWHFFADTGENFSLQAEGYALDVAVLPGALMMRTGPMAYLDAFSVTDAGNNVEVSQGDIVSENGKWYISLDFLRKAMKADVTWDEDENTLLIRMATKPMSESSD